MEEAIPNQSENKTISKRRILVVIAFGLFLFYIISYLILSQTGSYVLPTSDASESVVYHSYEWQPKFILWHKFYDRIENKTSTKANFLGYFYSPLLILDQNFIHKSKVTNESWVVFLHDSFIKGFKYGYINKSGEIVIELKYGDARDFSEGLAAVKIDGLDGYINRAGQIIIKPQFDYAGKFSEDLAGVRDANDKYGYINKSGAYVIEPQFEDAYEFTNGRAIVKDVSEKFWKIDRTGNYLAGPQDDAFPYFQEGLTLKYVNGLYGFADKSGKIIIEPQFGFARNFLESLAVVSKAEPNTLQLLARDTPSLTTPPINAGYIDKTGNIVIDFQFDRAKDFSEGMAAIKKDNKWGYIDKTGNIIIEPQFSIARPFSQGLAGVGINGKQGYIDKSGNFVIEPKFDVAMSFSEGLALVSLRIENNVENQ